MFTAKDLHNKLQALDTCEGIDNWIQSTLYFIFLRSVNFALVYHQEIVNNGWTDKGFQQAMRERGFSLKYVDDNRGDCYYVVSYNT